MMNKCGIQDKLTIYIYDEKGNLIDTREPYTGSLWQRFLKKIGLGKYVCNDIVLNAGLADVASFLASRYKYVEVGTDGTAPATTDTAVISPVLDRSAAATSIVTTFYTNDTVRYSATFDATYQVTIREAGLTKNASAGGDDITFARETFYAFTANENTSFTLVWDVVVMR